MLAFEEFTPGLKGIMGYAGVPKAGEDDGIGFDGAGVGGGLNKGAAFGLTACCGRLAIVSFAWKVEVVGDRYYTVLLDILQTRSEDAFALSVCRAQGWMCPPRSRAT